MAQPVFQAIDSQAGISSTFKNMYFLSEKDAKMLSRLIGYMLEKNYLPKKEYDKWVEVGIINDKTRKVIILPQYKTGHIIYPSFWLKCLLIYYGVL